jgi:hypothetical protein
MARKIILHIKVPNGDDVILYPQTIPEMVKVTLEGGETITMAQLLDIYNGNFEELANSIDNALSGGKPMYGVCGTAAGTAAKTVDIDGYELIVGVPIQVLFSATNTAANPTLNVSGTGAKPICYHNSAIAPGLLAANAIVELLYDGTHWEWVGEANNNPHFDALTADELNAGTSAALRVVQASVLKTAIAAIAQGVLDADAGGDFSSIMPLIAQLNATQAQIIFTLEINGLLDDEDIVNVVVDDAAELTLVSGVLSGEKVQI